MMYNIHYDVMSIETYLFLFFYVKRNRAFHRKKCCCRQVHARTLVYVYLLFRVRFFCIYIYVLYTVSFAHIRIFAPHIIEFPRIEKSKRPGRLSVCINIICIWGVRFVYRELARTVSDSSLYDIFHDPRGTRGGAGGRFETLYTRINVYVYITRTENSTKPHKKCTTNSNGLAVSSVTHACTRNLDVFIAIVSVPLFIIPRSLFTRKTAAYRCILLRTRAAVTYSDSYTARRRPLIFIFLPRRFRSINSYNAQQTHDRS